MGGAVYSTYLIQTTETRHVFDANGKLGKRTFQPQIRPDKINLAVGSRIAEWSVSPNLLIDIAYSSD